MTTLKKNAMTKPNKKVSKSKDKKTTNTKKCAKKCSSKKATNKVVKQDCPEEGCPIKKSPQLLSARPLVYIEPMELSFWQRIKNWFFKP